MKRTALVVLIVGSTVLLYGQQRGTPANLRVRVDANGSLLTATAAQVNPVTTVNFLNARLAVDSSGNLLTVGSGGSGITNIATTSPISGGPITTTGTISCPTCATTDGSFITSSYTPTIANITIGDGSITGTKMQIGKLVIWSVVIVFGSTTSFDGGAVTVSLPTAAINANMSVMNFSGVLSFNGFPSFGIALDAVPVSTTVIELQGLTGPDLATGAITLLAMTASSPQPTPDNTNRIQLSGAYFTS